MDIGFIAYDLYKIAKEGFTKENVTALGADAVGLLVPFATGGGMAVRAASKVDDVVDAAKAVDRAADGAKASAKAPTSSVEKAGEVYVTEAQASGKEYVGRTTQGTDKRMETRTDGRTGDAKTVDTYKTKEEGRYKEQKAIDQRGGKGNLDNKRNEVAPDKMKELEKKYGNQT